MRSRRWKRYSFRLPRGSIEAMKGLPNAKLVTQEADQRPRALRSYVQEINESIQALRDELEALSARVP
jgi:hypothetical protein